MSASDIFAAPPQLSDAEAASLHIAFQTAWFALHVRTNLTRDDWLLVHAAAGGVGSAAVQLAKAHGARVIAVVGGPEKATVARQLGADVVIDRWERDFVPVVLEVTDGRGADVVFDPVGGSAFERSTKCIAFEGRILTIGFAAGEIPSARLNHLLVKNYSVVGLHWGAYRLRGSSRIRECYEALCDLVTSGRIRPLVSEQLVLEAVPAALSRLERGETIGRVAYVA
jgi:NADPH2:quinone reductase